MDSSKKRLFVAIGLPPEIIAALKELQQKLKPFARDAKWVRAEGIHLTLKFLGYVEEERISRIEERLQHTVPGFGPAPILIRGCGFFPNSRRPNVLWSGIECPDILRLQAAIEEELAALGFEKENRAFSPHLTLARFRDHTGLVPLAHETEKWKETELGRFRAENISLYQSILHREGAEYRVLRSFPLKESE